jgi:antitoxin component YwqK of YwqJK toxin-antitoxin module
MAVEDPMGVLDIDPKKLELIREFFKEYTGDAGALSKQLQAVGRELGLIAEKILQDLYKARAKTAENFNEILSINKQIRDEELKTLQAGLVQAEKSFATTKERVAIVKEEIDNRDKLLELAQEEYNAETDRIKRLKEAGKLKNYIFARNI